MTTFGLAIELTPVFWGLIGVLVLVGVVIAFVDPEITEAYLGNPPTLLFATLFGAVVVAVVVGWLGGAAGAAAIWPWG